MVADLRDQLHVDSRFGPIFREVGIDAAAVFDHPLIHPWRTLPDRQNCILDATLQDGRSLRLHIKRYPATNHATTPADTEMRGLQLLRDHAIPTVDAVAWGRLADGRSFIMLNDLAGYAAADKLVERGQTFGPLIGPTAQLSARLHDAGLHHRDLYLCHFFAKVDGDGVDVRLIDTARVRQLPGLFSRRWVVKDLAQFRYSTMPLPVSDAQRDQWLVAYAAARRVEPAGLRRDIARKTRWIERHDRRLRARQPLRNVSIPT
jgi:heptose I phosphotransferase